MNKVLCFGEILLRISLDKEEKWLEEKHFPFFIGGAELNVARTLALWKIPTAYFTALPKNVLGDALLKKLNTFHVDCARVHRSGEKIGLYYLVEGADLKSSAVIYDRAYSAFADLSVEKLDWDKFFEDVSFFHFSAICPPLNPKTTEICIKAVEEAEKRGIRISIDLNYREQLWRGRTDVIEIMDKLLQYCHVVMGNIWAANALLGIPLNDSLLEKRTKEAFLEASEESAQEIQKRYPQVSHVANTFRFTTDESIHYYSSLHPNKNQQRSLKPNSLHSNDAEEVKELEKLPSTFFSKEYFSTNLVDAVGSGDCYMSGLLYGLYQNWPMQKLVDFASAAAFTKLLVRGETTNLSVDEINQFVS